MVFHPVQFNARGLPKANTNRISWHTYFLLVTKWLSGMRIKNQFVKV